ncbi:hypothetical protein CEXT_382731 [Caerostris extrusa]|uniref:Uncharacterized protein n=1 Tax=Caerostris extrusa TaxID=172846 RepID=A0AAV4UG14_CAEEX|nr:hypothetical protein CEXT_382731 [Caerostris extrusa]
MCISRCAKSRIPAQQNSCFIFKALDNIQSNRLGPYFAVDFAHKDFIAFSEYLCPNFFSELSVSSNYQLEQADLMHFRRLNEAGLLIFPQNSVPCTQSGDG